MIKYSVRFILWEHDKKKEKRKNKKQDDKKKVEKKSKYDKFPIYLRITINRNTKYIATGFFVPKTCWDDRNELIQKHMLANLWNADLAARKQNVVRAITEKQMQNLDVTSQELKEQFSGSQNLNNFFEFAEQFISEVKHKRSPLMEKNYRKLMYKLESFHGSKTLSFEQINHEFLVRFEDYLRKEKLSDNYIHALWRILKTFFNAARKRKLITDYPFETYENPKYISPEKDYLTLQEIGQIENLADETKDLTIKQTCIYFLLGCFTGLRISDWYQFDIKKHVKGNEILLRAKKNKEWVTMPIHSRLKRNLKRMAEVKLSITDVEVNRSLKNVAEKLEINKRISSHTGRHTMAITMCLNRGLSSEVAAELLGITLSTFVENYSQITKSKIHQEALRAWRNL